MKLAPDSRSLDDEILAVIGEWHRSGAGIDDAAFDRLALRIFRYQLEYNEPYRRYCARLGITTAQLPSSWLTIPAVPSGAFKEAALATFDPAGAALCFETSGTSRGSRGRHFMESRELYDAALLAAFDRFVLPDGARLRYFNLVPQPLHAPHSSLGYMLGVVSERRGSGSAGWYLRGDTLDVASFVDDMSSASGENTPVCITATAFALVHLLDAMDAQGSHFTLPNGSRVVETGGFKGRSRTVGRTELYGRIAERFCIPPRSIVAEYGMTELTSQYYDDVLLVEHAWDADTRRKLAPPWLRTRVVGPDRVALPNGTPGALVHVDLANRSSCVAIQTEDVGIAYDDGLVLIGREQHASPRGCSLDAEELVLNDPR